MYSYDWDLGWDVTGAGRPRADGRRTVAARRSVPRGAPHDRFTNREMLLVIGADCGVTMPIQSRTVKLWKKTVAAPLTANDKHQFFGSNNAVSGLN